MNRFRKTYRVIAGMMAVLMLSINVGFSADIHFCGGSIADIVFYGQAHSCGEMDNNTVCDMKGATDKAIISSEVIIKPTNTCCKDFTFEVQLDVESINVYSSDLTIDFNMEMPSFLAVTPMNTQFDLVIIPIQKIFEDYRSPFIPRDISVLLERFLI